MTQEQRSHLILNIKQSILEMVNEDSIPYPHKALWGTIIGIIVFGITLTTAIILPNEAGKILAGITGCLLILTLEAIARLFIGYATMHQRKIAFDHVIAEVTNVCKYAEEAINQIQESQEEQDLHKDSDIGNWDGNLTNDPRL